MINVKNNTDKKILRKILIIIKLARIHFLVQGFLLFLMGYLLPLFSGINFDLFRFLFGYLIFGLAHLSVSFSNDYFDLLYILHLMYNLWH